VLLALDDAHLADPATIQALDKRTDRLLDSEAAETLLAAINGLAEPAAPHVERAPRRLTRVPRQTFGGSAAGLIGLGVGSGRHRVRRHRVRWVRSGVRSG
jgi:hypothetical protein